MVSDKNVDHVTALRTPQFYLLWTAVMGNAVAGMTLMTSAKTVMTDVFSVGLPMVVTAGFATKYVASLSAANSAGRLGWSGFSDVIGRKNTYFLYGLGLPIAASIPALTASFTENPDTLPLYCFYGGTLAMISFYGGLFSTLPAYIADVYGSKHVGAIHGRLLTAWSAAAIAGPNTLAYLRNISYSDACEKLTATVDPAAFKMAFGAPVGDLQQLMDMKTVTIARLMEICPPGTVDPSPTLYDTSMYGVCGMLGVALLANTMMRPVASKYHMKEDGAPAQAQEKEK